MTLIIPAIGFLICIASLFAAVSPRTLLELMGMLKVSTSLRMMAVAGRIIIGVLVVLAAPLTDYPGAIEFIGVLLVLSGVILLFLNNSMLQAMVDWALKLEPLAIRIGAFCGLLLGCFVVYAGAGLS